MPVMLSVGSRSLRPLGHVFKGDREATLQNRISMSALLKFGARECFVLRAFLSEVGGSPASPHLCPLGAAAYPPVTTSSVSHIATCPWGSKGLRIKKPWYMERSS